MKNSAVIVNYRCAPRLFSLLHLILSGEGPHAPLKSLASGAKTWPLGGWCAQELIGGVPVGRIGDANIL